MSTEGVREKLPEGRGYIEMIMDDHDYAVKVLRDALDQIHESVQQASAVLAKTATGRIIYVGAGTPARLGYADGAELTPTFTWQTERVANVIAGGKMAVMTAVEGAEDNKDKDAEKQVQELSINSDDVVIAISASGRTPFTVAAMNAAREQGALTIGVASNDDTPLLEADCPVLLATGAEIVGGSTRMKAGTAQSLFLKTFSTAVMNELGFVYDGYMVAVRPTNDKLKDRAINIIRDISGCSLEHAQKCLTLSEEHIEHGDVRVALMLVSGKTLNESVEVLEQNQWNFGKVVKSQKITFSKSLRGPSSDRL